MGYATEHSLDVARFQIRQICPLDGLFVLERFKRSALSAFDSGEGNLLISLTNVQEAILAEFDGLPIASAL